MNDTVACGKDGAEALSEQAEIGWLLVRGGGECFEVDWDAGDGRSAGEDAAGILEGGERGRQRAGQAGRAGPRRAHRHRRVGNLDGTV